MKYSLLCNFIDEHPDNYEELLAEKNIKVKHDGKLAIFNYDIDANFHNPLVQEARGIIIAPHTPNGAVVVSFPFRKFGNYNESYADTIDWNTARVQDKIDGSIIKLFYNPFTEQWQFATNGVINAKEAMVNNGINRSFYDLIIKAKNYKDIPFNSLNTDYTYIFELVSPENRIVIKYNDYMLYHIGTRNDITGKECNVDIGIIKPNEYQLHSLDDCIQAVNKLEDKEGYVVVDANWNRVKIKSPKYLMLHHTIGNGEFSKSRCIELLNKADCNIDDFCKDYPHYATPIRYYQYQLAKLYDDIDSYISIVRNMYAEYSYERKAIALKICKHRLARFGFMAIDDMELTTEEIINRLKMNDYNKLIPDYQPTDFMKMFEEK